MAKTNSKISKLREKAELKANQLTECSEKIKKAKEEMKALKKEIAALEQEINSLELMQLSETLNNNGITAADVEAAIAAGHIKKSEPPQEQTEPESTTIQPEKPAQENGENRQEVSTYEAGSR